MKIESRCVLLSASFALLACGAEGQENWTRNFRVGLLLGVNVSADFNTGGQFGLGSQAGDPTIPKTNHEYDDGYVRVDDTGNARNLTGYWGYENPSQFANNTLTFHKAESVDITSASSSGKDDSPYFGLDVAYGGTLRQSGRMRFGWEAGFGFLPISIKDSRPLFATSMGTIHTYPTETPDGPIIPPTAPYHGGSSGEGEPLISDTGTAQADTSSGPLTGTRTLDVHLFTLRGGPTFYWHLHPRWAVSASAGGAVGLVTGDYRFDETVSFGTSSTHVSGKFGKTEFTYGGYVSALALFHLQPDADLFVGAQFMPMTEVTFKQGGREARLDLGTGLYFTAGINWPF
jgi:hypothetical protein